MPISFCHIINPFPCREGSEHGIASKITFASLRIAVEEARKQGIQVDVNAVVLPGDEVVVEPPAIVGGYLKRTIQDIKPLLPKRLYPLIIDILRIGISTSDADYVIFTNMDISVQPNFYASLDEIIEKRFQPGTPFIIYRRNVSSQFKEIEELPDMYKEQGQLAYGYDCFVFPKSYVQELDLGNCCIGAGHFDYLFYIALDTISGFRADRVTDQALTFHIGNNIAWSAQMDYLEFNLSESLAAIQRMRERYTIPETSNFRRMERTHFEPNARIDSRLLLKLKRLPAIGKLVFMVKGWLGRSH